MLPASDFRLLANPVDRAIGAALGDLRQARGFSLAELAERVGASASEIRCHELGLARIGAARMIDLAKVLDVPIGSFWAGVHADPPAPRRAKPLGIDPAEC